MEKGKDTVEEFWNLNDVYRLYKAENSDALDLFKVKLLSFLGSDGQITFTESGRDGLKRVLKHRHEPDTKRNRVLVPAFNCRVVKEAIEASGYQVEGYDFTEKNGKVDFESIKQLLNDNVHALIVTHFFGVPVDFRTIIEACRHKGVIIIEDCAHCLGGKIGKCSAGTLGDYGIFSFNYDKPISLGWGGAIIDNNDKIASSLVTPSIHSLQESEEKEKLELFYSYLMKRRKLISAPPSFFYKLIRKFSFDRSDTFELPHYGMGNLRAALGVFLLSQYKSILQQRNYNAEMLIHNTPLASSWWVDKDVSVAWLKQKVLLYPDKIRAIKEVQRLGLRVGNYNWPELIVDKKSKFPNALHVARYGIDLPVHQNITNRELAMIAELLLK